MFFFFSLSSGFNLNISSLDGVLLFWANSTTRFCNTCRCTCPLGGSMFRKWSLPSLQGKTDTHGSNIGKPSYSRSRRHGAILRSEEEVSGVHVCYCFSFAVTKLLNDFQTTSPFTNAKVYLQPMWFVKIFRL